MKDDVVEKNSKHKLKQASHSYENITNTKDSLRCIRRGSHEKLSLVGNPWSEASSQLGYQHWPERKEIEGHTWAIRPSTPTKNIMTSHNTRVGITGGIWNIIILGCATRGTFRKEIS